MTDPVQFDGQAPLNDTNLAAPWVDIGQFAVSIDTEIKARINKI
jgi:hypothetical protein